MINIAVHEIYPIGNSHIADTDHHITCGDVVFADTVIPAGP